MNKIENGIINYLSKKGLSMDNCNGESKIAKYTLKLYNKINGTNFKSHSPKIIIMKIDTRKSSKKATA